MFNGCDGRRVLHFGMRTIAYLVSGHRDLGGVAEDFGHVGKLYNWLILLGRMWRIFVSDASENYTQIFIFVYFNKKYSA